MTIKGFFVLLTLADTLLNVSISSSSAIYINGVGEWRVKLETTQSPLVYKHLISWNSPLIPQNRKVTFVGKKPWKGRVPGLGPIVNHTPEMTREGPAWHSGRSMALCMGSPGFREGVSTNFPWNIDTSSLWVCVFTTEMRGWLFSCVCASDPRQSPGSAWAHRNQPQWMGCVELRDSSDF